MKNIITNILSILFPFEEPAGRVSVFMQDTWIERIMKPTQVKDYLWTPSKIDWSLTKKVFRWSRYKKTDSDLTNF
jgi:hypothetical protein